MGSNAKKIVLAVDDMSMNLRSIQVTLEKQFDVRLAKSGEAALAVLLTTAVDLILLDIEMPGMSGFEALDQMKKMPNFQDVPVVFVTAHVSTELIAQAIKRGARDYVMKPFSPDVLLRKAFAAVNRVDSKYVLVTKDGKCIILPEANAAAEEGNFNKAL
jgi:putative two-component system response regulator